MIATCPACGKRYRLPDDAVPAAGRSVRCAACGHGWAVRPDDALVGATVGATVPADRPMLPTLPAAGPAAPHPAPASMIAVEPAASLPAVAVEPAAVSPAREAGDEPPPRRRWGWLVAVLLVIVTLAAAAVVEFAPADTFAPPRLGLPDPAQLAGGLPPLDLSQVPLVGDTLDRLRNPPAAAASPLRIVATGERRTLPNGTRVLTVTGRVTNPMAAPVALAGIDAALLDAAGHVAFHWRIAAPASVVGAGQSVALESVAANYPANATVLQLTPR